MPGGPDTAAVLADNARLREENAGLEGKVAALRAQIRRKDRDRAAEIASTRERHADALASLTGQLDRERRERDEAAAAQGRIIDGMAERIDALEAEMARMAAENAQLRGDSAYYEGANAPPSRNSKPEMRRRARRAARAAEAGHGAPGRRKGHPGISTGRAPARTVHHDPDKCARCGKRRLGGRRVLFVKVCTDFPDPPPMPETVKHVVHWRRCRSCGARCAPDTRGWNVPGTELGRNLATAVVAMYSGPASFGAIRRLLRDLFGLRVSKAAVMRCFYAMAAKMGVCCDGIAESIRGMAYLHMDETPFRCLGRTGYVWVAVGRRKDGSVGAVYFVVAASRGAAVLDMNFRYDLPVVTDGYAAYREAFRVKQRCWVHLIRAAENEADRRPDEALARLNLVLSSLFRASKEERAPEEARRARAGLIGETLALADRYEAAGYGAIATHVRNAAPDLYTFMLYPGMDPTNNAAEREIRPVVISRKIRHGLRTAAGMRAFGVVSSCVATWRAQGIGVAEGVRRVLDGEAAAAC